MMQVAADDLYDDYVICRGFDLRILKFIDYEEGNPNKPGISVAKPFGKRRIGTYSIGEVYPAFLPTQGNPDFTDFRQVTYVPPSPTTVNWRVGQNAGVVFTGALDGGQPEDLTKTIGVLRDAAGKAINWLLIDSKVDGGTIQGPIVVSSETETRIQIQGSSPNVASLIGASVEVVDLSNCILDMDHEEAFGVWVWAEWQISADFVLGAWTVFNRCCVE
jgi:hypothetical protein